MSDKNMPEDLTQALAPFRGKIDEIDLQLVTLLSERIQIVRKVGDIKRTLATQVRDHGRESMQM